MVESRTQIRRAAEVGRLSQGRRDRATRSRDGGAGAAEPRQWSRGGEARASERRKRCGGGSAALPNPASGGGRDSEAVAADAWWSSRGGRAMVAEPWRQSWMVDAWMAEAEMAEVGRRRQSHGVGFALAPTVAAMSQATAATMTAVAP